MTKLLKFWKFFLHLFYWCEFCISVHSYDFLYFYLFIFYILLYWHEWVFCLNVFLLTLCLWRLEEGFGSHQQEAHILYTKFARRATIALGQWDISPTPQLMTFLHLNFVNGFSVLIVLMEFCTSVHVYASLRWNQFDRGKWSFYTCLYLTFKYFTASMFIQDIALQLIIIKH